MTMERAANIVAQREQPATRRRAPSTAAIAKRASYPEVPRACALANVEAH